MKTNFEKLISMDPEELASFLHQTAEAGTQYYMNSVCEHCNAADCPEDNGCLYGPKELVLLWLSMDADV